LHPIGENAVELGDACLDGACPRGGFSLLLLDIEFGLLSHSQLFSPFAVTRGLLSIPLLALILADDALSEPLVVSLPLLAEPLALGTPTLLACHL
jgi:hypothetical protein